MLKEHAVTDDAQPDASGASTPGQDPHELDPEDSQRLAAAIEAILLTSDKPVNPGRLAEGLGLASPEPEASDEEAQQASAPRRKGRKRQQPASSAADAIARAVASLNEVYEQSGRAFRIEQVAGGYRLMTLPEFAPVLASFHHSRTSSRLSRAAVETLAIIAYRQPITRAHLEAIRGVGCGEVLRSLMERRLVTIKGRAEELGRPMLYGTTKEFLDAFGLASLKDLPSATELQGG